MNDSRMTVNELAKALGKSPMWVVDELRWDSKRDIKQWSFAISKQSETGRWSYIIIRAQFRKWASGDSIPIDYERLADMIAQRILEKSSPKV